MAVSKLKEMHVKNYSYCYLDNGINIPYPPRKSQL